MNNPKMSSIIEGLSNKVEESFIVSQNSDKSIPNGYKVFDYIEVMGEIGAVGGNSPAIGTYWRCVGVTPSIKQATYMELDSKKFVPSKTKFVTTFASIEHGISTGDVRVLDVGEELIPVAEKLSIVRDVISNLGIDATLGEKVNKLTLKEGCMVIVDISKNMIDDDKRNSILKKLQDVLIRRGLKSGIKKFTLYVY